MSKRLVIFQGTFDPFTNGHLAVVKTALDWFGKVRILLLVNPDKKPLFSLEERKEMIAAATAHLPDVSVDSFEGLLVDYMRAHHVNICVRGVRNSTDAAYEMENHALSSRLYPALQTVLISCPPPLRKISSSAIKEQCQQGFFPSDGVPPEVLPFLQKKFSNGLFGLIGL